MSADGPLYRTRRADGDRIPNRAQTVAYATELYRRADRPLSVWVAPEVRFLTADRARAYLDRLDVPGDVNVWSEREQRRTAVARRYVDGTWSHRTATGAWEPALRSAFTPAPPVLCDCDEGLHARGVDVCCFDADGTERPVTESCTAHGEQEVIGAESSSGFTGAAIYFTLLACGCAIMDDSGDTLAAVR